MNVEVDRSHAQRSVIIVQAVPFGGFADPNLVPSLLAEPDSFGFSVVTFCGGWPEDLERFVKSVERHCGDLDWELVAVSNASAEVESMISDLAATNSRLRGLVFTQHVGFGRGYNSGIVQTLGTNVVIADTSVEATGDFLTPIARALADRDIGLAGKWGLVSGDLMHFEESTGGECDAMQAYCMGFRRSDVAAVGLLDPKYKFYRNADIDWSLRWRDGGFRVIALNLPLQRHAHREWESLPEEQREKKSRDNFARLMRNWRGRTDLLTGVVPQPP